MVDCSILLSKAGHYPWGDGSEFWNDKIMNSICGSFERAGLDDVFDGKVLTSKVSNLKLFRMEHTHVKNITGIESFVSVENLFLWDNDFTTIDLSRNTKLKILGLSECPVSNVDLSKNTELIEIAFQHSSSRWNDPTYPFGKTVGIKSLDLSKNTKIQGFII